MSLYAKVKNGKVTKIMDRPVWWFDNGDPVTDEYLAMYGIYRVDDTPEPYNALKFHRAINSYDAMVVDDQAKHVSNYYGYRPKRLDDVYYELKKALQQKRRKTVFQDIRYDFPDGTGHVQLRNDEDYSNIRELGLEAVAILSTDSGDASPLKFMDRENVKHFLTPSQMADLYRVVRKNREEVYEVFWVHRDEIDKIYASPKDDKQKINALVQYMEDNVLKGQ